MLTGLPAPPSSLPLLKGRNTDAFLASSVQNLTSSSSTAKWTAHRPKRKRSSLGFRVSLYCSTAWETVCPVNRFFSSIVMMGRPLIKQCDVPGIFASGCCYTGVAG